MRIMIVDDNAAFRNKIKKLMRNQTLNSLEMYEFDNGSGAVENYNKLRPDLILMDIQMNDINGFDASRQIKKLNPDAKIIIVTQYNDDAYKEYADELGLYAYVTKDNLNEIISIVENLMNFKNQSKMSTR